MAMTMASTTTTTTTDAGGGDVSNCVSNLIHAFTDGLNIFKRLRERRRRRKSRKSREKAGNDDGAELLLSESLRRGPRDIQERYERCYGEKGERFARGDSIAHASLAETLIRLNTGLVSIIATFLNHDTRSKHHNIDLDYKSLTSLSDASRRDAMDSMHQLYLRLSQSQLHVHRMTSPKPSDEKCRHAGGSGFSKQRVTGPTVARVQGKDSNERQLVFMRPKNGGSGARKGSTSSSSSSTRASARTSPVASPLASPLPLYTAKDPFPFPPGKSAGGKSNAAAVAGRRRIDSLDVARPSTWPHPSTQPIEPIALKLPPKKSKPTPASTSPPPREKEKEKQRTSPPLSPSATQRLRRRADKATPSTYTFASDSTKLGEIPQRNWTVPWDYEEAARLNAEAAVVGVPLPPVVGGGERGRKRGLFGFLRKGA